MMRRNSLPSFRSLAAALLCCSALVPTSALAFTTPIVDPSGLAELKNQVQTAMNQLKELTEMKKLASEQLATLGDFGKLGNLFSGTSFSNIGSESDFYTNMENFAFDPCAINLCQVGDNPVGTTDIEEAREWAMKNFFAGEGLEEGEREDLVEIRRRAVIYSATNGVALATITHNDLAGAKEQADALEQIVEASESLRGDVRANSAIALAAYKIELQQLAILTSMLDVESSRAISDISLFHEEGGTEWADAYLKEDFAGNDRLERTRVTAPDQGSSSGSGFGGALMESLTGDESLSNTLSGLTGGSGGFGDVGSLAAAIQGGDIPTMAPDAIDMSTLVSDAASLASTALGDAAPTELSSALSQVQTGLTQRNAAGNSEAMLGLAQAMASSSGNSSLSAALNTASMAMASGNKAGAFDFTNGVIADLAKTGNGGQYVDHLMNQMASVEAGSLSLDTLVLDASAIHAALGSNADATVSGILQIDPAAVEDTYFRDALADALDAISEDMANSELGVLSQRLRATSEADVEVIRDAFRSAQSASEQSVN